MQTAFGCARLLYQRNRHPRVMTSPEDLRALRRKIRSGKGRRIMDGLRTVTAPLLKPILDANLDPAFAELLAKPQQTLLHCALIRLLDIAAVGMLDRNEPIIRAVERTLKKISTYQPGANLTPGWPIACTWGLAYDLLYNELAPDVRSDFARWAEAFIRACMELIGKESYFSNAGANTPISFMANALFLVLCIRGDPGVRDLSAERDELVQMLAASLHAAHGRDGYPTEDIGYGSSVSAALVRCLEAARRAGLYNGYRDCPRVLNFGQALLHFVQPWGEYLSNTGDHADSIDTRESALPRLAALTRDPTLLWLNGTLLYPPYVSGEWSLTNRMWLEVPMGKGLRVPASYFSLVNLDDLRTPIHPAKAKIRTSFRDRDRGIVSFRSGWDKDATFVVFDGCHRSPSAQGHSHASCGHFSLTALGEFFGIDMGRYGTEQSEHNLVLVDGKSGRSTGGQWTNMLGYVHGNLTAYAPGPFCDFAAADSSLQHDCYWARRYLGLVKGPAAPSYAWTVEDINKANDYREFWWTLNTCPENTIAIDGPRATLKGCRHGHFLDVHFVLPDPKLFPKPHTLSLAQDVPTTSSYKYIPNADERAQEFEPSPRNMIHGPVFKRPRLVARVAGYNGRFMSVMIPRRGGQAPATAERLPSADNSLAVRLTFPAVVDTLIWAYEHNLLEADGIRGRGNWCVVRRNRKTGKTLDFALGSGTSLVVDNKTMRIP